MSCDCAHIYEELLNAGETYRLALSTASNAAGRMAGSLELFNPLSEFKDFNPRKAADNFKGVAYAYILAELSARSEISPETRQSLKSKAYDASNPNPTEANLAAFAKHAKRMELESR